MKNYYISLLFNVFAFLMVCPNMAHSNIDSRTSGDTINEIIIYEYDTVYLEADTIKIIDTVVQFLQAPIENIPNNEVNVIEDFDVEETDEINNLGISKEVLYESEPIDISAGQWEMGIYVTPYISGIFKQELPFNSISMEKSINYRTDLSWFYYGKNGISSLSIGYESIHEQFHYNNSYFSNTPDISGVYDSLLIQSHWTIHNYYDYLNISLGLGKAWGKNKLSFVFHAALTIGILTKNHEFLPDSDEIRTQMQTEQVNYTQYSVSLQQGLAYKINKKIHWYLLPTYRFHFYESQPHPLGNFYTIGLNSGFSISL